MKIAPDGKSYTATYVEVGHGCFDCGSKDVEGEGVFSTGAPLPHYTPEPDELLKNKWMVCNSCGLDQGS